MTRRVTGVLWLEEQVTANLFAHQPISSQEMRLPRVVPQAPLIGVRGAGSGGGVSGTRDAGEARGRISLRLRFEGLPVGSAARLEAVFCDSVRARFFLFRLIAFVVAALLGATWLAEADGVLVLDAATLVWALGGAGVMVFRRQYANELCAATVCIFYVLWDLRCGFICRMWLRVTVTLLVHRWYMAPDVPDGRVTTTLATFPMIFTLCFLPSMSAVLPVLAAHTVVAPVILHAVAHSALAKSALVLLISFATALRMYLEERDGKQLVCVCL